LGRKSALVGNPGGGGDEGVCQLTPTTAGVLVLIPLLAVTE
jgi:hypothetical protein